MLADIITVSRILFSLLLFILSPSTYAFSVLYILCGVSDVLDGFVARKLHTESETGARLDSIADLIFAFMYAVKILPHLSVPVYIWIWTAIIAVVKISGIFIKSKKKGRLFVQHSFLNKLTGVLLFVLPLTLRLIDIKYSAVLVCVIATFEVIEEISKMK